MGFSRYPKRGTYDEPLPHDLFLKAVLPWLVKGKPKVNRPSDVGAHHNKTKSGGVVRRHRRLDELEKK